MNNDKNSRQCADVELLIHPKMKLSSLEAGLNKVSFEKVDGATDYNSSLSPYDVLLTEWLC